MRLALAATDLLMYANHAVNFFLYCATGQKFRHQLCSVVCFVVGRPWRRASPSRVNVGGAATGSVGLPRRRALRRDNILHDGMSLKSVDRHTAAI